MKKILLSIAISFALILLITVILSSIMQGYYKEQITDFEKDANDLLNKKAFWSDIGEFPLLLYICGCGSLLSASITAFMLIVKNKNK